MTEGLEIVDVDGLYLYTPVSEDLASTNFKTEVT